MDSVKIELDPFRTSDGILLFRRTFRPATAPIGDLLICHGIGESSSRYIQAARALAEAGWRDFGLCKSRAFQTAAHCFASPEFHGTRSEARDAAVAGNPKGTVHKFPRAASE